MRVRKNIDIDIPCWPVAGVVVLVAGALVAGALVVVVWGSLLSIGSGTSL